MLNAGGDKQSRPQSTLFFWSIPVVSHAQKGRALGTRLGDKRFQYFNISVPGSRVFTRKLVYERHFESRGGQTVSTSFNIHDNKRNVEQMLKQSENVFKLIQHRFNFDSTSFNTVLRGWQTVSTLLFNEIEWMLKQMLKPFARAFSIGHRSCGSWTSV